MANSSHGKKFLASFGRKRGRKLRSSKQALMDTLLGKLSITLPEQGVLKPETIFSTQNEDSSKEDWPKEYWLEIGFGGGEHLAHQAQLYPDAAIIGCEPYIHGIAWLLAHIKERALNNIRIYTDDARFLMEKLPDASFDKVFILYPDPWPKTRHQRRRLVSTATLNQLARIMKPGAQLRLATDDADYCTWMLEHVLKHPDFIWQAKDCDDWLNPPADWIRTRYEQKAIDAGRVPSYLNFKKS